MKQNLIRKIPGRRPRYLGVIALLLITGLSFAATPKAALKIRPAAFTSVAPITIKGKVTDAATGESLIGVSVKIKGSGEGVATDADGNYAISAEGTATLVFTYLGYEPVEVAVENKTAIDVKLKAQNKALTEVVVIGYGTAKKISLTGAVDRVSGDKAVEGRPVTGTVQALQGESPNLIIQQKGWAPNGGSFNINIRGTGTTGNNDPLVVIDGIIGGDINTLNPSDIDNISVLKDAGSAAIYGSRSANGVILVTTKKGKLNAKPTITYSGIYGTQVPKFTFHPVDAWVNAEDKNMSLANSGKPPQYTQAQIDAIKAAGNGNWRLETIMHNAPQTNQNLSISGGSATNTYLMSFGYFDQRSYLEPSLINGTYGLRRFNFRLNETATLGKFNTAWNLTYAKIQYNEPYNDVIGDTFRAPLTDSFQDAQGRYITGFVTNNPLDLLRNGGFRYTNNDEINGSFTVGYNITPSFKVRAVFGGTVKSNSQLQRDVDLKYYPTGESNSDRQVANYDAKSLTTNTNLIAEYTKTTGKHDINILLGVANESYLSQSNGIRKSLTDSLLGVPTTGTLVDPGVNLSGGGSFNSLTNTTETSLNSVFARGSYSYANKYFLDATIRADESSNFPKNKRWGYFPSIGGSWRLTEEAFMSDFRQKVGDIRVRANYGILGNQSVNPYQYVNSYNINGNVYAFNNQATAGATLNLANPDITWEKAATLDIGADGTFLNGKLTIGADYFNKVTSDILAPRQDVPTLFGSSFPTYNVSKVQDRGWEVKIGYNIRGDLFSHSLTFSISDAKSKLLAYSYGQTQNVFQREEFEFVRKVGYPITVYQGYKTNGLYQTQAEVATYPHFANYTTSELAPGDWKFVDRDGNGVIDANDKFILGDPFPHYTFGFNYNVTYKHFDATIFIQGVLKRDALIRGELIEPYHFSNYGGTVYDSSSDFWTPQNTGAKYPRLAENGTVANNNNFRTGSDMYLFNAAYARLKNIQVGYSFPTAMLSKVSIQRARVYFTAQNVFTLSPLKFTDPEGTEFGNNLDNTVGANSPRGYPTPVFYGVGLDLTF
ncbi:TonB-dependent receptor [Mucilaginibacter sp. UR6-11]|uniref:SusC/RagA family TonB-linked outer membrane protein n=1 Tax=Mucilaginibacter sp. UR6-11 TaxID=1435644 RepID=UPI001E61AB57|nr:TonB-dependent receptor [Mucilaginibacter sp. UR6-11]MCC8425373.1 TonB-dependent receptor [Mucilaginibacter sp. UR6-11]